MFHSRGNVEKHAICCRILKGRQDIYWLLFKIGDMAYVINLLSNYLNINFMTECKALDIIYSLFFIKVGKYSDGIVINALDIRRISYREALVLYYPSLTYVTFMQRSEKQIECVIIVKPYCSSFYIPVTISIILFFVSYLLGSIVAGIIPEIGFVIAGAIVVSANIIVYQVSKRLHNKIRKIIESKIHTLLINEKGFVESVL